MAEALDPTPGPGSIRDVDFTIDGHLRKIMPLQDALPTETFIELKGSGLFMEAATSNLWGEHALCLLTRSEV